MDELKLAPKKKIRIWVSDDVSYDVSKPTNRDLYEFTKAEGNDMEKTMKFLAALGLPEEAGWALSPEDIEALMNALIPKQKKS